MKVLHVIPSLSLVHGGPSRAIVAMESALAAQGVRVETATTDDDGPGHRNGKPCGVPLAEGDAVRWYFAKRTEFYKASPGFARWIVRHVRDYDLVHIHALFSFTSTAAGWAARRAGVPYVVRPLGTLAPWGLQNRRPALKRLSLQFVETPLLRGAAALHFTSGLEAEQARALGLSNRGVVLPLGVNLPLEAGRPFSSPPSRLLFLSRLDPKKNLEALLEAMAMLTPRHHRLTLSIAGAGEAAYESAMRVRAEQLGVAGRVRWLGAVDGAEKAAALAAADLFVLPSFAENFGIAAAEALAAGLPCVLGKGVAIAAEVEAAGAGVSVAPTPQALADALDRIISAPELHGPMSQRARALAAEQFTMAAMGARLQRLYAEILQP